LWRFNEVREGLQVALDYMQKSIMDLQKFSECVTKDTSVDEVVHRVNNIIVFLESSVQREYSAFCEESPSLSVRWKYEWNSDDYEGHGFVGDDDDWDGMNRDDRDCDSDLCMY
jgi:hypothetical protein